MPDISKCSNDTCPLRATCYRFMVPPSDLWQSYNRYEPNKYGTCGDYLPVEDGECTAYTDRRETRTNTNTEPLQ